MINKNRIFWAVYIYLTFLVAIRLIPMADPTSRSWGFNPLIFLPDYYTYIFFIIGAFALILPLLKISESIGERMVDRFSSLFFDGNYPYRYRLIFMAIMIIIFALNTAPTHFLGDGYNVIANLSQDAATIFKWTESGMTFLFGSIRDILGDRTQENARLAFQIVSVLSGAITIYFFFLIAKQVTENRFKRLLLFVSLLLSGTILLFFGYVEYYPLLWVFISGFVYFAIRYITTGHGIIRAWIFILIGIVLHVQLILFVPGALLASLANGRGLVFYSKFRKFIWGVIALSVVAGIVLFFRKYTSDLYFEDMFLPFLHGKPIYKDYAILSWPHLLDIFNELILTAPLVIVLLPFAIKNARNILSEKIFLFLLTASIGPLVFLFVIDPKLAFARDWDLFSMSFFSINILAVSFCGNKVEVWLNRLIPSIIIVFCISTIPFVLTNLKTNSSGKYIEYIIDLDYEKSLSSFTILQDYYKSRNNKVKADSLAVIYQKRYNRNRNTFQAMHAIIARDIVKATKLVKSLPEDKFDAEYHRVLGMYYLLLQQYDKAMDQINMALQLRRYAPPYIYTRGRIYFSTKRYKEAIDDFNEARILNPKFFEAWNAIAIAYDLTGQYDSCNYYAQKSLELDSTSAKSYSRLARSYAYMHKIDSAKIAEAKFAQFVKRDSTLKIEQQRVIDLFKSLNIEGY